MKVKKKKVQATMAGAEPQRWGSFCNPREQDDEKKKERWAAVAVAVTMVH